MKNVRNIGLLLLTVMVLNQAAAQNSRSVFINKNKCHVHYDVAMAKAEASIGMAEELIENIINELENDLEALASFKELNVNILGHSNIKKGFFFMNDYFEDAPAEEDMKDVIYDDGSFEFYGEIYGPMPEEKISAPSERKGFKFMGEEFPAMPEESQIL